MKRTLSILVTITLAGMFIMTSCKKNEPEPEKHNTPGSGSASINGTQFTPTSNSASHNGSDTSGYMLSFTDGTSIVSISTTTKTSGTYSICSNCRVTASDSATAYVTTGGTTYKAKSGTITITVATDGTISGSYTFDAISASNVTISIKDGKFEGITVTQVSAEEYLKNILMAKDWYITTYQDGMFGDLKLPDRSWEKQANSSPGGGPTCEAWSKIHNWKNYIAHFTSTSMLGTFFHETTILDSISMSSCTPHYSKSSETDAYTSAYTYNSTDNSILVNFGNIFNTVDDAHANAFLNLNYKILSLSTHKVVLEGTAYVEGKTIVRKIVLE